ncbi:effector-associated constant component EACC1 [Streptomyces sp. 3214.6]|uniref:effector-associated constant component EACC1 n=1 Tax=Streptomyces sp. 3214.6 TaxID=1882757 RepID=UPI00090C8B89|nr:hypothetical protein [Streptomyces sp. 3214.6]SHI00484.1 hypothetical protein SAMN05444521_3184 [Streptomyces sp. 3214.6]
MKLQITVGSQGDDMAAHDLYHWLRQDRELRRHAQVELALSVGASGRMSAGETINMFVSNGLAAASLLVNIVVAWRTARPSSPGPVVIGRDGMTVTVHDTSEETLRRVATLLASTPPEVAPGTVGTSQASTQSVSEDR